MQFEVSRTDFLKHESKLEKIEAIKIRKKTHTTTTTKSYALNTHSNN
jgi:hypothetical protein